MKISTQGSLLAATVASLLAAGCASSTPAVAGATAQAKVQCKEANSCKGNGSCAGVQGGAQHACKGQNGCAGNVRALTAAECAAINGSVIGS